MEIGFIGLGAMGFAIAGHLTSFCGQSGREPLRVYNRTPDKAQALLDKGAVWSPSPAELAASCDVVLTCLSDDQALFMQAAESRAELEELKTAALKVNKILQPLFLKAGLKLINFKLKFGRDSKGQMLLADEISPDTCRLWDTKTGEKYDKDRFRRDLGRVEESYQEVLKRLKDALGGVLK
jgi:phosphoribosylaminoimidazole-succinocarboxamide synthase